MPLKPVRPQVTSEQLHSQVQQELIQVRAAGAVRGVEEVGGGAFVRKCVHGACGRKRARIPVCVDMHNVMHARARAWLSE